MIKIISTEKNGEPTFTVDLTGDIKHIAAEISYAIAGAHTTIKKHSKKYAKVFREEIMDALGREDAPAWGDVCGHDLRCRALIVRKGEKLTGDDIADLLRRGTPTHIIKALLEEMDA